MLTIVVRGKEIFNEETEEFSTVGDVVLELEHSLVSLSKWEMIFEKPFLTAAEKTNEETLEYVKCMTLTPNVAPEVFFRLSQANIEQIDEYLGKKMTATWFDEPKNAPKSSETITSELVYYWMSLFNIPFAVETWPLNRLLTLIKIHNIKNTKQKPMSQREIAERNRTLNAKRKAELGTKG